MMQLLTLSVLQTCFMATYAYDYKMHSCSSENDSEKLISTIKKYFIQKDFVWSSNKTHFSYPLNGCHWLSCFSLVKEIGFNNSTHQEGFRRKNITVINMLAEASVLYGRNNYSNIGVRRITTIGIKG